MADDARWRRLDQALRELSTRLGAANVAVLDASGGIWSIALRDEADEDVAYGILDRVLAKHKGPSLQRGGRVSAYTAQPPFYCAESFAGLYILLAWFDRTFDVFGTREALKAALPAIEALTTDLPPSGGPRTKAAARTRR